MLSSAPVKLSSNETLRRKRRVISWIVDYINAASRGEYVPERFNNPANLSNPSEIHPRRRTTIAIDHTTRAQPAHFFSKQAESGNKPGNLFITEGYDKRSQIKPSIRPLKKFIGAFLAAVIVLGISTIAFARAVTLQWMPVNDPNLAGYKVYYTTLTSFADVEPVPLSIQDAIDSSPDYVKTTIYNLDSDKPYLFAVTAYDSSGDESVYSNIVTLLSETPTVNVFTLPSESTSLEVPLSFIAGDDVEVTGFLITESPDVPLASDTGWSATAPTSFIFSGYGVKTAYAWAKDAADNISAGMPATVTIDDSEEPTIRTFTLPATATSLTVQISSFSADDNVGVTGYLISTSSTKPPATGAGWSDKAPNSFTFSRYGTNTRTVYAWAKDEAGNVSDAKSATVTFTLPDTVPPSVSAFTLRSTATPLTARITSFSVSDNVAVVGFMITDSGVTPSAGDARWLSLPPASFVFHDTGYTNRTAYAWAKDAAGNVSCGKAANVTITLPPP